MPIYHRVHSPGELQFITPTINLASGRLVLFLALLTRRLPFVIYDCSPHGVFLLLACYGGDEVDFQQRTAGQARQGNGGSDWPPFGK
jgi:hypothetical protein